ncbi:DMT family transporter [Spirulina sp. CS-785/01]|uniref:DMT family transporter n=1 Tax=Spirulina sp. CS-785/01 TaxID=3021716 RepID=UPI00232FB507|nr:DMT family transporter [Spirulina sp. CS-785/01]MDB9315071.1 DMT family transporter [Spirulina sp. CS-785/01]
MSIFSQQPRPWQVSLVLGLGVFAVSTAAIFIRLAMQEAQMQGVGFSLFVAATRLLFAAGVLLPGWRTVRQTQVSRKAWGYAVGAGVVLAAHFVAWVTSLSFTSIAASTTLVTTNPVWVTILAWWWFGERLSQLTIFGIILSLLGGGLIAWGGAEGSSVGSNPLLGDGLALMGAWCVSLYFLLGREAQREGLGTGSYVVVAYTVAALVLLPLPLLWGTAYWGYPGTVYLYILLMALISQVFGHTVFNWAVRWVSPTFVTLGILFEPVGSSGLGFLVFGEVPGMLVVVGAMVLLLGVAIAIFGNRN